MSTKKNKFFSVRAVEHKERKKLWKVEAEKEDRQLELEKKERYKIQRRKAIESGILDSTGTKVICPKTRLKLGKDKKIVAPLNFDDDLPTEKEVIKAVGIEKPINPEIEKLLNSEAYIYLNEKYKDDPEKLERISKFIIDKNAHDGLQPTTKEIELKCSASDLHQSRFFLVQEIATKSDFDLCFLDSLNKILIADAGHKDYSKHKVEIQGYIDRLSKINTEIHKNAIKINLTENINVYGKKILKLFKENYNYNELVGNIKKFIEQNKDLVRFHAMYTDRFNTSKFTQEKVSNDLCACVYDKSELEESLKHFKLTEKSPDFLSFDNYERSSAAIFLAQKEGNLAKIEDTQIVFRTKEAAYRKVNVNKIKPIQILSFNEDML
jgi:hypothetical protein